MKTKTTPKTVIKKTTVLIIAMALHGNLAFSQVPQLVWGRQLGTTAGDFADRVAADADGNSWFAGNTSGNLGGQAFGGSDIVVGKYDPLGNQLWVTQFGTAQDDSAKAITLDPQGNAYITGNTAGKLGDTQFGGTDAFISKLNTTGAVSWIRQFGTTGTDAGNAIKLDAGGNIFVVGATTGILGTNQFGGQDCFLSKFDPNGQLLWIRQWGTSSDDGANGMALDQGGNIYVVGYTSGRLGSASFGNWDMFLTKIDPAGNILWSQQYGTSALDSALGVAVDDETNIYVGGSTYGSMGGSQLGQGDSVLLKLSPTGTLLWQRQFGTTSWDGIKEVLLSPGTPKGVIVSGCGRYPSCLAFARKFDPQGNELWKREIIPAQPTCGGTIAMDGHGNFFQCGGTSASLYGAQQGNGDIFLVKYLMLDLFPPMLTVSLNDTNVNLSWSTNYPAFTLESVVQLGGTWTPVPGVTGCSATLPISADSQFFRLSN
jgi:Beta-propeller repeat